MVGSPFPGGNVLRAPLADVDREAAPDGMLSLIYGQGRLPPVAVAALMEYPGAWDRMGTLSFRHEARLDRAPERCKMRSNTMSSCLWRYSVLGGLAVCLVALLGLQGKGARAETCLSPFVKRLDRPEKILYVFCVDADAKDNDFLAVVDVNPDSATFGTTTYTLDLGSKGNETHHFGYTDDRTRIWAGGLLSSRIWLLDVATDPSKPRIEKVLDHVPQVTGLSGPHTYYAL